MNIENAQKLCTRLRSVDNPVAFYMGAYFKHGDAIDFSSDEILEIVEKHPCGTAACLAGQAAILAWQEDDYPSNSIFETAREFLGLDSDEATDLFHGFWTDTIMPYISKEEAIEELTRLIEKERSR